VVKGESDRHYSRGREYRLGLNSGHFFKGLELMQITLTNPKNIVRKKKMLFSEITRSFASKEELDQFLEENPAYLLKMLYGNHGINAVIHDIRLAEVKIESDGIDRVIKWLE
jgi:hypothetical protein